jgi:serine/threonine protein kinase/tetratricopeptide (TPR) repeat protein/TolB-like protein
MGVKCPKCHFDNPSDSKFCKECGTQIIPSKEISVTETLETPTEELTRGTTFANRYEIIEELGKGGMGKVYRVEDKKIKEEIALKLIKPEIASDKKTIERFSNELKIARKIRHKNVCGMYDLDEKNGTYYIAMEYVPGEDLKSFIWRSGQLAVGTTIKIAKQVSEGLAEAHRLGIIHRDLKPSNIMIDKEGNARIMDFGIARSFRGEGLTREGIAVGTPAYMSPEQARGQDMDQRTDIWSLGVVLYEMLTGQLPFKGKNEQAVIHSILNDEPEPVTGLRPETTQELGSIVEKALAKSPDTRYANIDEMLADIQSFEKKYETKEVTPKVPLFKDLWKRRLPQIVGIYLIATKAVIELVKWFVNRVALSPNLSDFILVVLLSMIPAVSVVAYFHRRRGRAKWVRAEKIIIPMNLLVSAALLIFLFYGKDLGTTTKTVTYTDEEGKTVERIIPKSEFRKKVALCYFDNKSGNSALDWLQYGIVSALRMDLIQDLYLTVGVGFDPKLKEAGFEEGVGVPLTLKREIAQDRHLNYFVTGSFTKGNGGFRVNTSLYETKRMKLLEERSFTSTDIFRLIDEMSVQLKHDLKIPAYHIEETEDKPVSEMLTDSISAFSLFAKGHYLLEREDSWEKAEDYFEKAVEEDPTFAYAWFDLMTVYFYSKKNKKADEAIRAAVQHDYKLPEKDKFEVKFTYYVYFKQDLDMVFALAKKRIELFPHDIEGHEWLASAYKMNNQLDEALSEYKLILELDPEQCAYFQEIAKIYEGKGEFEKALEYHKQYADKFPGDPTSFSAVAALYQTLGDFKQAKAYYKKALLIEPENIRILLTLASIESSLGNFNQSLEQYQDALEVCKTSEQRYRAYNSLSDYHLLRGQTKKAIDYRRQSSDELAKYVPPMMVQVSNTGLAEIYIDAGKTDLALKILEEVEGKIAPFWKKLLPLVYMWAYLELEDADNAEKMLEGVDKYIKTWGGEGQRSLFFDSKGRINEIRGEYGQAILDYQKSLELTPTETLPKEGLGRCHRKLKEYAKAERLLQEALKIEPFNPKFNYEIALVYWDWGKKEKALEHLNRALYVWEDADLDYKPAKKAKDKLAEWESYTSKVQ